MKEINLMQKYIAEAVPKIKETYNYKNNLAVPKIEKVVINVGFGRLSQQGGFEDKILPEILSDLSKITGQKPAPTTAKKSIAGFKIRQGQIVGAKVTLRGRKMYDFIERLIKVVLPRVRDFKGIDEKNIDSQGNLHIGLKEHVVFPDINPEALKVDFGLEISIVSNAKKKEESVSLYRFMGIPLKKD